MKTNPLRDMMKGGWRKAIVASAALCASGALAGNWSDPSNRDTNWPSNPDDTLQEITHAKQLAQFAYIVNQDTSGSFFKVKVFRQ